MNQEQLISLLRQALLTGGGFAVGKGYVDQGTMEALVGAIVVIATSIWAIYTRRTAGLVAAAAAQPTVTQIVAVPHIADAVSSSKVVAP